MGLGLASRMDSDEGRLNTRPDPTGSPRIGASHNRLFAPEGPREAPILSRHLRNFIAALPPWSGNRRAPACAPASTSAKRGVPPPSPAARRMRSWNLACFTVRGGMMLPSVVQPGGDPRQCRSQALSHGNRTPKCRNAKLRRPSVGRGSGWRGTEGRGCRPRQRKPFSSEGHQQREALSSERRVTTCTPRSFCSPCRSPDRRTGPDPSSLRWLFACFRWPVSPNRRRSWARPWVPT